MGPIDNILNKTRPCENFMERIIFWKEVHTIKLQAQNVKQCGEPIAWLPFNFLHISSHIQRAAVARIKIN